MDSEQLTEYSMALDLELKSLTRIQKNKYCTIFEASTPTGKCIIKKYLGDDPALVTIESQALLFYHELARVNDDLIDSGLPILNAEKNLLCIGFVEGTPFNDYLYKAIKNKEAQDRSANFMNILGKLIRTISEKTLQPGKDTAPFIYEYFEHASRRLEEIMFFGPVLFRGYHQQAIEIMDRFRSAKITPSFVHGDFVFKNIHVGSDKVGLIDFANAIFLSHPLNDIYNMRMALGNMVLPAIFKTRLLAAFEEGLGDLKFPAVAHEFYGEYQRRRWLMLKFSYWNPREILQGLRGLATFAKPHSARSHFP